MEIWRGPTSSQPLPADQVEPLGWRPRLSRKGTYPGMFSLEGRKRALSAAGLSVLLFCPWDLRVDPEQWGWNTIPGAAVWKARAGICLHGCFLAHLAARPVLRMLGLWYPQRVPASCSSLGTGAPHPLAEQDRAFWGPPQSAHPRGYETSNPNQSVCCAPAEYQH